MELASEGYRPIDYKFCVISGFVAYVVATAGRSERPRVGFYDREWRRLPVAEASRDSTLCIPPPDSFRHMVEAAETLAAGFDMLRVDFYDDGGEPVFGEFTVYPRSGYLQFDPPGFDGMLGERWSLVESAYLSRPPSGFARVYRAALISAGITPVL